MHGIPKFLLPVSGGLKCLLDYHVSLMAGHVDYILIPTRPEWASLLESFQFGDHVRILTVETETMAETVARALDTVTFDTCVLGMPDTYFFGGNPYRDLATVAKADVNLAVFSTREEQVGRMGSVLLGESDHVTAHADKNPDSDFGTHWGVIEFTEPVAKMLDPRAATGGQIITEALSQGLDVRGFLASYPYFDCGTFEEYLQCIAGVNLPGGYRDFVETGAARAN